MPSGPSSVSEEPEYAWEVATLFPSQGDWGEEAYLSLTDSTNKLIELADGRLEFLSMPTEIHQALVQFLFLALHAFVDKKKLGQVHFMGLRVRIRKGRIREPDLLFLNKDNYHLRHNRVWDGADLVMEVVSDDPKDRKRDYEDKLVDYAECGIAEYWIVDPQRQVVIVYQLTGGQYAIHGEYSLGDQAVSPFLKGFCVDVTALFAVADEVPE